MARRGHGLILGKFLPPHAGHEYLVRFGSEFAERLTVLVCTLAREPIPGALRYAWMRELFPEARVRHVTDDVPQEPREHPRFWDIWRELVLREAGEPIDYVFASETYGERLAAEVGATFIPVDVARATVPVSGTAIRARPLEHWDYLPPCVRPYYLKRVCLFGPESTGKSTLARDLARRFATQYVAEFARGWLDPRQGVCTPEDLPTIVRGQTAAEDALARRANRVLFCDTDPLLTSVWSRMLFGDAPDWLRRAAEERRYDLYLLTDVDVPWVDDHQRSLQHRRREFFELCRRTLEEHGRPYRIVRGTWDERLATAVAAVASLLAAPTASAPAPE